MLDPFPVLVVDDWAVASIEPAGRDRKPWLYDPDDDADEVQWLFKPVTLRDDRRQGEDWSEKLSSELARRLGVPAAHVELARRGTTPGVLSRDVKPGPYWEIQDGAVLISAVDPRIAPKARERLGHSLVNIERVLSAVAPPSGWDWPSGFDGFSVFCGYLVLDAWIANQDRHEANWSVLRSPDGRVELAPSYDHASSLGFNLLDQRRRRVLQGNPGIARWAARGRAQRFEDGQQRSLVAYAAEALTRVDETVRDHWLGRLEEQEDVSDLVSATPEMSEDARTFCIALLETNRRRLLDACR